MKQIVYSYDAGHNARYVTDNCDAAKRATWPTEPQRAKRFETKAHAKQCVDLLKHHGIHAEIEQYNPAFHGKAVHHA